MLFPTSFFEKSYLYYSLQALQSKYMHADLLSERINSLFVILHEKNCPRQGIEPRIFWHDNLLPYQLLHSELMMMMCKIRLVIQS
jgi:hypothetical protein